MIPMKLPATQSILIIGALLLKIQGWAFFVVWGAYREIKNEKKSSLIQLQVPSLFPDITIGD